MNILYSPLKKQRYLSCVKSKLDNPVLIFEKRITGFVIGPFFALAHYQPYEWNHNITSECNRAYGYVKEEDGRLRVSFIRSRGLFSPLWLIFITLLLKWGFEIRYFLDESVGDVSIWPRAVSLAILICGMSAAEVLLTPEGEDGRREMDRFLQNPAEYTF